MKLQKCRKGQIRILEAFFATLLIFSALFLVSPTSTSEDKVSSNLYSIGMNTLLQLDTDGSLSKLIGNRNWNSLRSLLQQMLPSGIWFNLTVLDEQENQLNDILISNGNPISDRITAVKYVCAASNPKYSVYIIYLQLARAD